MKSLLLLENGLERQYSHHRMMPSNEKNPTATLEPNNDLAKFYNIHQSQKKIVPFNIGWAFERSFGPNLGGGGGRGSF